jgi:regulatory protein
MARANRAKKLDAEGLWEYALRLLSQRAHSLGELRTKLLRRAEVSGTVPGVLDKLREYGLADDRKFSETFASLRLENEGLGKMRVLRDLRARKVPSSLAEAAVRKTFQNVDEHELAERFLLRKYRTQNLPEYLSEQKHLASAYRRLRAGGFGHAASLAVLKRHSRVPSEWEDAPPEEEEESGSETGRDASGTDE